MKPPTFVAPLSPLVPLSRRLTPHLTPRLPAYTHPRRPRACPSPRAVLQPWHAPGSSPESDGDSSSSDPSLFVDEGKSAFWDSIDVSRTFGPITDEEKAALLERLPRRVAEFLIRRADAAIAQREAPNNDGSFLSRFLDDIPPDVPDWEAADNVEYKDYVYETALAPPAFRRSGSSLFGGGDGLPDVEDLTNMEVDENGKRKGSNLLSLFVGNVGSIDEQASRVGYSLMVVAVACVLLKIVTTAISFFVSFTFSFFAIFALSAGIFVVFFLLRF